MDSEKDRIGWIGVGRMGGPMIARLLAAGYPVTVWNRTREKAEPFAQQGAAIADSPADLAGCDIVFTMVAGSDDFKEVTIGARGVLAAGEGAPAILIDSSTVSADASDEVRRLAAEAGTALLAAPVSGNPSVVRAGKLTIVASGDQAAFERARPVLETLGRGVSYVGEGDAARLVKIAHNLALGIVAQTLAEITVLVEKGGISRADFLSFFNDSVMGSMFSRYKTPALVTLDYTPSFTPVLLLKDFDLGLEAGEQLGVSMPVVERVRELIQGVIDEGYADVDFAAMLSVQAKAADLALEPEPGPISDGLTEGA
ncbi:MAG TPA: NAD(P)-dependent oxidoreductase [Solirubrobacteraceae bacterium]|jgi:3-hydroxyisobutyrate dehydrogenase-like beta-hydroxyacid dehydrogenase|nr:NAD(P)-dependent oxidoreductase [Solirubrobacteraceae bacterium]